MQGQSLNLFRLGFLLTFLAILWVQSLFTDTEHVTVGQTQIYRYNNVAWFFVGVQLLMLIGFAEIARRVLKDRFVAVTCWLAIPFFACFVGSKNFCERVELTPDLLIHRREPPHTQFNVDIPWDSISAATMIKREKPGLFAPNFFNVGYELQLTDGRNQELPSNTVLTRAHEDINRILAERRIPIETRVIPMQKQ